MKKESLPLFFCSIIHIPLLYLLSHFSNFEIQMHPEIQIWTLPPFIFRNQLSDSHYYSFACWK